MEKLPVDESVYRLDKTKYSCREVNLFDPETASYLGVVQVQYTRELFNTAVKHYSRYIKERCKWFARFILASIVLDVLLLLLQWFNLSYTSKLSGISRLIFLLTLSFSLSMFILITRRIKDFKQKTASITFAEPAWYVFYKEGIVFYESHQQGELCWDDFYDICYEDDYLWLLLHSSKNFSGEATKAFSDIFIPANAINAHPELDTFFRERLYSPLDYLNLPNFRSRR